MGIGGEYSAINSAIDEMMAARYRGCTDIWINGTYWLGAILGTFASFLLLNSMRPNEGWRAAFLAGPALAFVILIVRRNLPESPRWLISHGREAEAEEAIRRIEEAAISDGQHLEPAHRGRGAGAGTGRPGHRDLRRVSSAGGLPGAFAPALFRHRRARSVGRPGRRGTPGAAAPSAGRSVQSLKTARRSCPAGSSPW